MYLEDNTMADAFIISSVLRMGKIAVLLSLSVVIILITNGVRSTGAEKTGRRRSTFVNSVRRYCPSTTSENPEQDEIYESNISQFVIPEPPIASLKHLENLTRSDILSFLNKDNYRENACSEFNPIESDLIHYLKSRESCLARNPGDTTFMVGYHRTLCANDFMETLEDILTNAGDECIDSLYHLARGKIKPAPENLEQCKMAAMGSLRAYHNFKDHVEYVFQPMMKNCFLNVVESICGAESKAQFQVLTDRLAESMNI